ncbi:MAG: nucleotide sugar dehydrogenase [Candidatus Hydrogenedentota bacterium]
MSKTQVENVGIIGLGYVGLPLAVEFARGGLHVIGVDVEPIRVAELNQGNSHILDVRPEDLAPLVSAGKLEATTDFGALAAVDAICICVPTPLRKSLDPDISYIVQAAEEVSRILKPGVLVVLESTTYPGTTEEVLLPKLEESGLKAGKDFHLAFSPERVDPGNQRFTTRNTPKVVGGVTPACVERAVSLYTHAVDHVVPVNSARAAEMVKLLENTFRAINIGLVNELAIICDRLGVDVWEVIEAAKTKPFGFMPFYPGPGLGGHCIPIDPLYLSWKLRTVNYTARFIELASSINSNMPEYVVEKITDALNGEKKSVNGSRILMLGVAYKRDVSDMRESPALDIMALLFHKGAFLSYADPYVPEVDLLGEHFVADDLEEGLERFDCVVIATDHSAFDYQRVVRESKVVYDARNATAGLTPAPGCRLVKL